MKAMPDFFYSQGVGDDETIFYFSSDDFDGSAHVL